MTTTPALATRHDYRAQYGFAFEDVIHVYQDANDQARGMAGYTTEFGGQRSAWRTQQTLAEFAAEHFGKGTLRRIGDDVDGRRYVVLRELTTKPQKTPPPVIKPIRTHGAPVFPSYAYNVV